MTILASGRLQAVSTTNRNQLAMAPDAWRNGQPTSGLRDCVSGQPAAAADDNALAAVIVKAGGGHSDLDWIERTLHISPDGGSGLTDVGIPALALIILIAMLSAFLAHRRSRS